MARKPPIQTPHGRFLPVIARPGGREDEKGVVLPPAVPPDQAGGGGGSVEPDQIDSTENVGLPWGVQSINPDTGNEPENYVLTADGDGGSVWAEVDSGVSPFFDAVADLAATRDLIGYWRLGEGASPFLDTSGAGNDLVKTATGTAMTDDVVGALPEADDDGAVQFNAVSGVAGDYLSATDSRFDGGSDVRTAALFVKPQGTYTGTQYILGTLDTSNHGWAIGMSGATRSVLFRRQDSGGNSVATGPPLPNEWTFVSVDWDPALGVNIYLNGALVFTNSVNWGISGTEELRVGRSVGTPNSFQGAVDEISLWGDRLTAAEHALLAASGGLALDSGLRAVLNITGAYTIASGDDIILAAGTFTVTLPTAFFISGKEYTIKNIGSGAITVAQNGSETIDGSTDDVVLAQNDSVIVVSDGSNWQIIGSYP